jgi:hypothetical protein
MLLIIIHGVHTVIEFVLVFFVIPGGPPTPPSLAELVKQQQQLPQPSQTPAPTINEIPWVVVKKRRSSDECDALSERHSDGLHVRRSTIVDSEASADGPSASACCAFRHWWASSWRWPASSDPVRQRSADAQPARVEEANTPLQAALVAGANEERTGVSIITVHG